MVFILRDGQIQEQQQTCYQLAWSCSTWTSNDSDSFLHPGWKPQCVDPHWQLDKVYDGRAVAQQEPRCCWSSGCAISCNNRFFPQGWGSIWQWAGFSCWNENGAEHQTNHGSEIFLQPGLMYGKSRTSLAERAIQTVPGHGKTFISYVEHKIAAKFPEDHPLHAWACFMFPRF